jgi:hypothetical protein
LFTALSTDNVSGTLAWRFNPQPHRDRGYDSNLTTQGCHGIGLTDGICAKKKREDDAKIKRTTHPEPATAVNRTHSCPTFGQLRRNAWARSPSPALILSDETRQLGQALDRLEAPICARS